MKRKYEVTSKRMIGQKKKKKTHRDKGAQRLKGAAESRANSSGGRLHLGWTEEEPAASERKTGNKLTGKKGS